MAKGPSRAMRKAGLQVCVDGGARDSTDMCWHIDKRGVHSSKQGGTAGVITLVPANNCRSRSFFN